MQFKSSFLSALVASLVAAAPAPSQLKRTIPLAGAADLAARQIDASAVVNNGCAFEVYVQEDINGVIGPDETAIPAGSSFTFPYPADGNPVGLFVGEASGIINGDLVIEYVVNGPTLDYDISIANGNPFAGNGLQLVTTDPTCPTINCPVGDGDCGMNHQEETCSSTVQLQLLLCQPA